MSQKCNISKTFIKEDVDKTTSSKKYNKEIHTDSAMTDILDIKTEYFEEVLVKKDENKALLLNQSFDSTDELNPKAFKIPIDSNSDKSLHIIHPYDQEETSVSKENIILNRMKTKSAKCQTDQNKNTPDLLKTFKTEIVEEAAASQMEIDDFELTAVEMNKKEMLKDNINILEFLRIDFKSDNTDISNEDYRQQRQKLDGFQRTSESLADSNTEMNDVQNLEAAGKKIKFVHNLASNKTRESVDKRKKCKAEKISIPVERKVTRSLFKPAVPNTTDDKNGDSDKKNNSDNECHVESGELKCEHCDNAYKDRISLAKHMERKHLHLECTECGLEVYSYKALIEHGRVHDGMLFSCKQCEVAFSNAIDFLKHSVRHRSIRKIACEICSKVCKHGELYKIHIISTHKEDRSACEICSKTFKNEGRLHRHMRYCRKNILKCPECGVELFRKYLDEHMISHTGLKIHQCLYCGKGFTDKPSRYRHTKQQHLGKKINKNK